MIETGEARLRLGAAAVRLEGLPEAAGRRPLDVAEAFRDLPGLALLESGRPGRRSRWSYLAADPVEILEAPTAGRDPFATARDLVARMAPGAPSSIDERARPPFLGGLIGYLSYDLGHALERLPTRAVDDQGLAVMRLALHDWVIAWANPPAPACPAGRPTNPAPAPPDRRPDDFPVRPPPPASPTR